MVESASSLPVPDVGALAFAAVRFVGPARPEIEAGSMMHPGGAVLVRRSPGVRAELFDVGTAPLFVVIGRRFHQHLQPFVGRRVAVQVDVEPFKADSNSAMCALAALTLAS